MWSIGWYKKKSEEWAEFAEDLKTLVNKGFPKLPDDAKKQLALQTCFQQLDQLQIGFSMKQERPVMLNAAITAIIKMVN